MARISVGAIARAALLGLPNRAARLEQSSGGAPVLVNPSPASLPASPLIAVIGASRFAQGVSATQEQITQRACGQWTWASIMRPTLRQMAYADPAYEPTINASNTGGLYFAQDGTGYVAIRNRLTKALASDANILIINSPLADVGQPSSLDGSAYSVASYVEQMRWGVDYLFAANATLPADRQKYILLDQLWERGTITGGVWTSGASGRLSVPGVNTSMASMGSARTINMLRVRDGAPGNAALIDAAHPDTDPRFGVTRAGGTNLARTGDDTHLSPIGGKDYADILLYELDQLGIAPKALVPLASVAGNLMSNPYFSAQGGTVNAGFVGGSTVGTGWTATLDAAAGATVQIAKISKVPDETAIFGASALEWQEFTITGANGAGGGLSLDLTIASGLTVGTYYEPRLIVECEASDGWRAVQFTVASPSFASGSRGQSRIMGALSPSGSAVGHTDTAAMPYPPEAWAGQFRGFPFKANGTTAEVRFQIGWAAATGARKIRITGVELRQVAAPQAVNYDESLPAVANINSPASVTVDEETDFTFQLTADRLGRWSLSGTDAALFQVDRFGKLIGLGPFDFEGPTDAGGNNVYDVTVTFTPFDTRVAPINQSLTVTVLDVADGFSDNFTRADQSLETSPNWTRIGGIAGGMTILSNQLRSVDTGTTPGTIYLNPQQGTTRFQRVSWKSRSSGGNGAGIIFNYDNATGDMLFARVSNTNTVTTLQRIGAGAVATLGTYTAFEPIVAGSILQVQVINIGGVHTVEVFQKGVKLPLASGTADVTAIAAGGQRAGAIGRSTATTFADDYNNRVAAPIISKIGLLNLVWNATGNATTTGAAGVALDLAITQRKTANSDIFLSNLRLNGVSQVGDIFFADGISVRSNGTQAAGTWTFDIAETLPGAVNTGRVTSMTVTVA
jgi:hypothetical protein